MESKAKFLGHPIHTILVVFPLGLLVTAFIFDIVRMITGNPMFATVAFWCIAAGVLGGLITALFGFIDWSNLPSGTRAKSVGMWHGLGNLILLILFAISWFLRRNEVDLVPGTLAFILALLGVGIGGVTSWLGGELVNRLGVGVDPGAHLNAPNSLSGQPAAANQSDTRV